MALPRYHWWIVTQLDGRTQLIYGAPDFGPDGGEDAARMKGLTMLQGGGFQALQVQNFQFGTGQCLSQG